MKVHNNNNVESKIRIIVRNQRVHEIRMTLLISYDAHNFYESISESVEKQMERNYGKR